MNKLDKIKKNLNALKLLVITKLERNKYIVIKSPIKLSGGKVIHFNWGDDMNYYLIKMMSGKEVISVTDSKLLSLLNLETYMCIGSIVSFYSLDNTVIWGSGIINENRIPSIHGMPNQICAVRGPLTRNTLLKLGYECPPIYGDPILLLPKYYNPSKKKEDYEYGVIPHYIDKNSLILSQLKQAGFKIIDIQNYKKWQDFVDEICSCKYILSSSLHGLICAEAYNIPSVWIGLSDYEQGWDFKFRDFYMSIGKNETDMIKLDDIGQLSTIEIKLKQWTPGSIDLDLLISSCPFYKQ